MWKRGFDASLAKELVESHERLEQSLRDRSEIVRILFLRVLISSIGSKQVPAKKGRRVLSQRRLGRRNCGRAMEFVRSDAGCMDEPVLHEQDERLMGERSLIQFPTTKTILHKQNSQNNIPTYRFTMTMGNPPLSSSIPGNLPNCILHFEPV